MMNPLEVNQIKNFDELIESDKIIEVRHLILIALSNHTKYEQVIKNNRTILRENANFNDSRQALSFECAEIDFYQFINFKNSWVENKYKIMGPSVPSYPHFELGIFNPYQERLQELMDRSIEAGLPKMWNLNYDFYAYHIFHEDEEREKENGVKNEDLDLKSLIPMFFILPIGFTIALVAFLCEIFHHDFIDKFSFHLFWKNFKKFFKINYF